MKRLVFLICLICFEINMNAQFRIGLTAGADINFPISDALYQSPTPGYSLGIVGLYSFSDAFCLKTELTGSDARYGYTKLSFEQITAIQQCKMSIVSVPIQCIWRTQLPYNLFLNIGLGLQYSRLISGSAYVCDKYGQGELWEINMDSIQRFDYPEYHEVHLDKVDENLFSGIASMEISNNHLSTGIFISKGINAFSTSIPFVSKGNHKTLDKIGIRLSYFL